MKACKGYTAAIVALVAAASGCSGRLDTGDQGQLTTPGNDGVAAATAGDAACVATCSTPAGTEANNFASPADAYAALVGRWRFCGSKGAFPGAPSDAIGVEYDAPTPGDPACLTDENSCGDGAMYYLVAGPNGPERGAGFAYQLTYDLYFEGAYNIAMHPTPNSGFGSPVVYSPCPTELYFTGYGPSTTLVPVY
jgi:hypothetical protein